MTLAHVYGWKRDVPDHRDLLYHIEHGNEFKIEQLPVRADLLNDPRMPAKPYDQAQEGSCTANSGCGLMKFLHPGLDPSRQGLYWSERDREGTTMEDAGAQIRTTVSTLATVGVGLEASWPYLADNMFKKPDDAYFAECSTHEVTTYSRIINGTSMRTCLNAGFPFLIGFTVYDGFESQYVADTGFAHYPRSNEESLGGHAVLVIGYDDSFQQAGPLFGRKVYHVRNSWGDGWGQHGNFWVPARYFENPNLASDAWTIRK